MFNKYYTKLAAKSIQKSIVCKIVCFPLLSHPWSQISFSLALDSKQCFCHRKETKIKRLGHVHKTYKKFSECAIKEVLQKVMGKMYKGHLYFKQHHNNDLNTVKCTYKKIQRKAQTLVKSIARQNFSHSYATERLFNSATYSMPNLMRQRQTLGITLWPDLALIY